MSLTRRSFSLAALSGLGALAVPKTSRAAAAEPRHLLIVFARGAWDVNLQLLLKLLGTSLAVGATMAFVITRSVTLPATFGDCSHGGRVRGALEKLGDRYRLPILERTRAAQPFRSL